MCNIYYMAGCKRIYCLCPRHALFYYFANIQLFARLFEQWIYDIIWLWYNELWDFHLFILICITCLKLQDWSYPYYHLGLSYFIVTKKKIELGNEFDNFTQRKHNPVKCLCYIKKTKTCVDFFLQTLIFELCWLHESE